MRHWIQFTTLLHIITAFGRLELEAGVGMVWEKNTIALAGAGAGGWSGVRGKYCWAGAGASCRTQWFFCFGESTKISVPLLMYCRELQFPHATSRQEIQRKLKDGYCCRWMRVTVIISYLSECMQFREALTSATYICRHGDVPSRTMTK